VRPPHGFILADGTRRRIENDELLRSWVLGRAGIREARNNIAMLGFGRARARCPPKSPATACRIGRVEDSVSQLFNDREPLARG